MDWKQLELPIKVLIYSIAANIIFGMAIQVLSTVFAIIAAIHG